MKHHLNNFTKIALLTTVVVFGLGCTAQQATNANIQNNTNIITNEEVNANETEAINNENINKVNENDTTKTIADKTEIDISGWNTFTFEKFNFSIFLPFQEEEIEKQFNECGVNIICDSSTGYSYSVITTKDDNYIFFSSVSEIWTPKREGMISDMHDFSLENGKIVINPHLNSRWSASILAEVSLNTNEKAYIFDPIQDYYAHSELYNINDLTPAYAAVIPLNSASDFKAALMYIEKDDMSLDEMIYALENIEFN